MKKITEREKREQQRRDGLYPINIFHYFSFLEGREMQILLTKYKNKNFKFILPSEELHSEIVKSKKSKLWTVDKIEKVCSILKEELIEQNFVVEVADNYDLTEEDINNIYKCGLIAFEYGGTFIAGRTLKQMVKFKTLFLSSIKEANIQQAKANQNK